jgi:hypothetical protein
VVASVCILSVAGISLNLVLSTLLNFSQSVTLKLCQMGCGRCLSMRSKVVQTGRWSAPGILSCCTAVQDCIRCAIGIDAKMRSRVDQV